MPPNNRAGEPFAGHFLCVGRWGAPSEAEQRIGVPHNGQVNTTPWQLLARYDDRRQDTISFIATHHGPFDLTDTRRQVTLSRRSPVAFIEEWITSTSPLDRPTNVVQHVTLGPPFLSASTRIYTNAGRGFDQRTSPDSLNASAYPWPEGRLADGRPMDLTRLEPGRNFVSSHIYEIPPDSLAYVMAHDPVSGLVLGYVYRAREYPWLNVWHHHEAGRPVALGLEFGTTGLGRPYKDMMEGQGTFLGRPSYLWFPAGSTLSFRYLTFLIEASEASWPPALVTQKGSQLILTSRTGRRTVLEIPRIL